MFYMVIRAIEMSMIGIRSVFVVKYFILEFGISGQRAALLNGKEPRCHSKSQ